MTPMQDETELDPMLQRLFAQERAPLPSTAFLAALELQLRQAQRRRFLWSAAAWGTLAVILLLLTPLVVYVSLELARYYVQGASGLGTALVSPFGVACVMAASLYALRRVRAVLA
jgi:hypothetical protein